MGLAILRFVAVTLLCVLLAALIGASVGADEPLPPGQGERSGGLPLVALGCCMDPVQLPGLESGFSLALSRQPLPVIGRTADARRVALLLQISRRDYSVVWVNAHRIELTPPEMTVAELPILVGGRSEVYAVDEAGTIGNLVASTDRLERWQWREDGSIVGWNDDGLWRWDPQTGALDRLGERASGFSPDGRYLVRTNLLAPIESWDEWGEQALRVTIAPLDAGIPVSFDGLNFWYHLPLWPGPTDPTLAWAPDSSALLSYHDGTPEGESGVFVLHPDGNHAQVPFSVRWLADSTLFASTQEIGTVYGTDGAVLREFNTHGLDLGHSDEGVFPPRGSWRLSSFVSTTELVMLVRARPPAQRWYRLDLRTGDRRQLPSPIDVPLVRDTQPGWILREGFNRYALFAWGRPSLAYERPPDVPPLYLYDSREHSACGLDDVVPDASLPSSPLQVLWSDDYERFAVTWSHGPVYIVEANTLRAVRIFEAHQSAYMDLIDWSPDGARLLLRIYWEPRAEFNRRVFGAYDPGAFSWHVEDFRIVRAADGRTLQTLRIREPSCWEPVTARWSPDSRWLALAGTFVVCEGGPE